MAGAPGIRERSSFSMPTDSIGVYFDPATDISDATRVAMMSPDERESVLAGVDMDRLQYDARFWARPSQLAALDSKKPLVCMAMGRGGGKSWTVSQKVQQYATTHPGARIGLVGRSASDVRDISVLGDSGIMSISHPDDRPKYRPSVRRLEWKNGAEALLVSADNPDALRGVQFELLVAEEVGSWRVKPRGTGLANAWTNARIATRLTSKVDGSDPQIFVATTPRRVPMIIDIVKEAHEHPENVLLVRGSTMSNRHLSKSYLDTITGMYAGTAVGAQELEGALMLEVSGALLQQGDIDGSRITHFAEDFWQQLPHRVVGVDPSVSAKPNDECGIVVVGATGEKKLWQRRGYVLEDASMLGSPHEWARRVVEMARKYRAVVVAEQNQGGEMVKMVIQAQDSRVPVTLVQSVKGKYARAEPVALRYQQGRVHHLGHFTELETQLTTWTEEDSGYSPDRLDAMAHAATTLLVKPPTEWIGHLGVAGSSGSAPHGQHLAGVDRHDPFADAMADAVRASFAPSAVRSRLAALVPAASESATGPEVPIVASMDELDSLGDGGRGSLLDGAAAKGVGEALDAAPAAAGGSSAPQSGASAAVVIDTKKKSQRRPAHRRLDIAGADSGGGRGGYASRQDAYHFSGVDRGR